tara:strand:- start:602 stop:1126 length:525 start_codon:yes stop_codon:yes gene_type:complete
MMANFIKNGGQWGPIEEGAGAIPQRSYTGRQIVIDFDNTETTSIMYTNPIGVPLSTETQFIWNTEAVDCANTADMQIMWQGTDDPSVANAASGSGSDVSAEDTGWTTVEILDLNGSSKCDVRTGVNLSGVSNVVNKPYARFKLILTVANPGDVDITCRVINLPQIASVTHSVTL